jgi:4-hydroxy-3-methylbut-2-en-1-yl diphosphate reductase
MAIESLHRAIRAFGTPVYVYHEIVHNRWVVERFRRLGAVFVNDLSDVPEGAHLLYSAHGVSPEVRRLAAERRLQTIDATCPLVTKVHREARRYATAGYTILHIGHAGHDEVVATMGEAPQAFRLIQTPEDVDQLTVPNPEKLAYLTQTTLSVVDAARIVARLRQRFPGIAGPSKVDICYATQHRQEAVQTLAPGADAVLVVGSRNSSNSRRLAELAEFCGISTHLIDGPEDIDADWFSGSEKVLITAGASAPEDVVQECLALLQGRFAATVETRTICSELVAFPLPKPLRKEDSESEKGSDPLNRVRG